MYYAEEIQRIRQQIAANAAEATAILERAGSADLADADAARADELTATNARLEARVKQLERAAQLREHIDAPAGRVSDPLPHNDPRNVRDSAPRYSLVKAMREQITGRITGLEAETSAELARRLGKEPKGFLMPLDLDMRGLPTISGPMSRRANDLDTTAGAGAVHTTHLFSSFIDLLRARTLLRALGATVLADLNGKLAIPKQTAGASAAWVTEGNAPTKTRATVGSVPLVPRSLAAYTGFSRLMLAQTSLDVEAFIRMDIANALAVALDTAGFNGSGVAPEPEGILQNSNVPTVPLGDNGDEPTWAALVGLETEVAAENADFGALAYVTTPRGRGRLKTTLQDTNTYGIYFWGEKIPGTDLRMDGQVNGYPAAATNCLPSDLTKGSGEDLQPVVFGDWSSLIIGLWGGLDILLNPYSEGSAGNVLVHAFQEADIVFRRDESFAKIVDMTIA